MKTNAFFGVICSVGSKPNSFESLKNATGNINILMFQKMIKSLQFIAATLVSKNLYLSFIRIIFWFYKQKFHFCSFFNPRNFIAG
jgi:hypothetical protein